LKVTPVPIPNTKVKLQSADGTAGVTLWKSRSLPGWFYKTVWLLGQAVKTPPFHGGNRGSIPLGVTISTSM
jgi:hypothetical protein